MSRSRRYDYLLSSLPALEPIGSIPPMSKGDFLDQVIDSNGPVQALRLLSNPRALLAEEVEQDRVDLAVISLGKAEQETVLPDFLLPEEGTDEQQDGRASTDAIWSRYFYHAASVANLASASIASIFLSSPFFVMCCW